MKLRPRRKKRNYTVYFKNLNFVGAPPDLELPIDVRSTSKEKAVLAARKIFYKKMPSDFSLVGARTKTKLQR